MGFISKLYLVFAAAWGVLAVLSELVLDKNSTLAFGISLLFLLTYEIREIRLARRFS